MQVNLPLHEHELRSERGMYQQDECEQAQEQRVLEDIVALHAVRPHPVVGNDVATHLQVRVAREYACMCMFAVYTCSLMRRGCR
jgi:hypothetical protein